ncbi:MAG: DUF2029 domain-containing protein [Chloroflexi bacterium]|nr:DUF2029 domain-containing protein [Chloroflexota bacterium]MCI0578902.1 DUF2029 domain-containing protein [Chloroflexota bacterium]
MTISQPVLNRWRWPLLALLLMVFLVAMTWANYTYLHAPKYVHRDFMSLWAGGWAILHDIDPYDPELWRPLRLELGSKWTTGDAGNAFPLWTLVLFTPLSALDSGWAAAIWLTLSQALLALSVFLLAIVLGERRPTVAEFALLAFGAFQLRGTLVTLHNGQITLVLLAIITLFLVFMKQGRPFTAGFVLAFIVLKPNPFILFAPLLALWLLLRRQWRVVAGGGTALAILLAASWLVLPGWLFTWQNVRDKLSSSVRSFIMPTLWGVATEVSVDWAPLVGLIFVALLTAVLGWYVFHHWELDANQVVSLALVGSLLVTPYAWAYEHALLIIPLVLLFTRLERRLAWAIWLGLVYFLPWFMYWAAGQQQERSGRGTAEVLIPLLSAAVVWLFIALNRTERSRAKHGHEVAAGL